MIDNKKNVSLRVFRSWVQVASAWTMTENELKTEK